MNFHFSPPSPPTYSDGQRLIIIESFIWSPSRRLKRFAGFQKLDSLKTDSIGASQNVIGNFRTELAPHKGHILRGNDECWTGEY